MTPTETATSTCSPASAWRASVTRTPKYVQAMGRQLARVHVGSFTTEHRAALVKLLADLAPGDLNRTQFYSSGAEAMEAAVRLAKSRTGHHEIIGFCGGFHGKTVGVLAVLGASLQN